MKDSRKKEMFLYSPLTMTEALKELGETYDRKSTFIFYGVVFIIALYLGIFFELKPAFMLIVSCVYLLCVPQLIYNQKKQAYELKRFHNLNVYMSQMAQTFVDTNDINQSLRITARSISTGRMHDTLIESITILDEGISDLRSATERALKNIEEKYSCDKVRDLHDYLLSAEDIGGECTTEFAILEKIRSAWKNAVLLYHKRLIWKRALGTLAYGVLLLVCIFILNFLRDSDVDIIGTLLIQIVNTILISLFIIYFVFMDKKVNASLLKDAKNMSEEKSNNYFKYINEFNSKTERRKNIIYGILSILAAVILFIGKPNLLSVALGIGIIFLGFNIHKIILILMREELRNEIKRAFPKWLFDVMLLIQRESVEGAIEKTISSAPPVLRNEIRRINKLLKEEPHSAEAYTSFFADFSYYEMEEAMTKLYALSIGTGEKDKVMSVIIESNIEILQQSELDSLNLRGSINVSSMVPILFVGGGFIIYLVAMFIDIIADLAHLI